MSLHFETTAPQKRLESEIETKFRTFWTPAKIRKKISEMCEWIFRARLTIKQLLYTVGQKGCHLNHVNSWTIYKITIKPLFYTVGQKGCHLNHINSWSIYEILSLLQRVLNFQQNHLVYPPHYLKYVATLPWETQKSEILHFSCT